jgi:ubiquinone/menaquinone biosynthesis C-methylase UbiE
MSGLADDLTPPEDLVSSVGSGDFRRIGQEFLGYFTDLCDLQPSDHVLDVGCGIGRMAIPLVGYLDSAGRYAGFDIVEAGITWCTDHISVQYPNFNFARADIYNARYNPGGRIQSCEFVFPYEDESFDFIFATSVFTHMLPADVEHYLMEIRRVLKPTGRTLTTFFLLNDESVQLLEAGRSRFAFPHDQGVYRIARKEIPDALVAYQEDFLMQIYEKAGLRDVTVHHGGWCGRELFLSQHDIVVSGRQVSAGASKR